MASTVAYELVLHRYPSVQVLGVLAKNTAHELMLFMLSDP